jgi:tRNA-Thr(GGU) m(6)t(6)A37 methyltransferase TsaA
VSYSFDPIGIVHSCFHEKFAIPRQPSLAAAARGILELYPPYDKPEALAGLEEVSHIWLLFVFHAAPSGADYIRVRPPRLGGNQRIGVFASRSTHRPNPLGQSVVRLDSIEPGRLLISGIDLLDATPVLDIKPYVPYADSLPNAHNGMAAEAPAQIPVTWNPVAWQAAREHAERLQQPVIELIEQCLAQDPKPAYQRPTAERHYGVRFWDLDVRWYYPHSHRIKVISVEHQPSVTA